MHIVRLESRSFDEAAEAVDLGQSPADIVFLSFSDSDLNTLAAAWETQAAPRSLRLANLAQLKHPFSVDLYIERVCAGARIVIVRLLGGMDYWRYGVDQLAAAARQIGFGLALIPGDRLDDERLRRASTLATPDLDRLARYFDFGGIENLSACLKFLARKLGDSPEAPEPKEVPFVGGFERGHRSIAGAPRALIVFYRSMFMAGDASPIEALAEALHARGASVESVYVSSLKDEVAREHLKPLLQSRGFDVILNATSFSARSGDEPSILDLADAPVLQLVLSGASVQQWVGSSRGLNPTDLAMHVAMPEFDGRILSRAISFKQAAARNEALQFARAAHAPEADRIAFTADLALAWAHLRRKRAEDRRIACIWSDYPGKAGRAGYAVGLDAPASAEAIAQDMRAAGYRIGEIPSSAELTFALEQGEEQATIALADYTTAFDGAPPEFRDAVSVQWGAPADDPTCRDGAFRFRIVRCGHLIMAVQPDRGSAASRKGDYHAAALYPRHSYIAFYFWLRRVERIDAMIHLGAHGTLEWLPGKSVALSCACAPEVVLGPMPVIYPFIVNNPGEAAQAKRRIAALTLGHLTPPLVEAGAHGTAAELESLFDEYASAQDLDPPRARLIARLILEKAADSGLAQESGADSANPEEALGKLDAWLCDLKDMRIGDGLHVYGRSGADANGAACARSERENLLRALDGRFVAPGPAGAPSRGRSDIVPTGRNLFTIDPRGAPTRNAWEIGKRVADEVVARYAQDHGEWPRRIVLDLWGSATMRTGGEDIAQAITLIGARPKWDDASSRVTGFDILPLAMLGRSRVDVTLRISGLFRDVFPAQIAMLNQLVAAVAALDEAPGDNPLAGEASPLRIFGGAPGRYGVGIGRTIAESAWRDRQELGDAYLAATSHAYGFDGEGVGAQGGFAARVAGADAFVHSQDVAGQDLLDSQVFAAHEGGFAAAARNLGGAPALYHVDTSRPERPGVRPLAQEIARVLRARAANPRWIAGQMRHGHRGAAEIAEALDNLFAFAALTDAVASRQFDLLFDATLGEENVREFLLAANPLAARGMAARFEEARQRGFWITRRNSSAGVLAQMLEAVA